MVPPLGCLVNNFSRTFSLFFLLLALCVPDAWARLDGEVEWGYAHYEQSGDGGEEASASHFTQRYSLMYSTKGLLGGGRLGYYDLGIGTEWGAFETDYLGKSLSNDANKYLYGGVLHFAPGGLPFRLHAYSFDTQKIRYSASRMSSLGLSSFSTGSSLFNPGIVTTLSNGQTISSGIQFIAGIRNGSYLGKYRELLSKWPRLLVDYRDIYRRDMTSDHPQKYRDRNLAFVSLNKKDN